MQLKGMILMNNLIKLLIKKCEDKNTLTYDNNLIKELLKMTNQEIIDYLTFKTCFNKNKGA